MRDKALRDIARHGLLGESDRVIVALSGGADSVSLLHLLYSEKEKYNLTLYAFHLNHLIRGEEAERDERFVRSLCERMGVELICERADIPALAQERGQSLELCARTERYRRLLGHAQRLSAKAATAHTMSDNAETVLLNLCRGAGIGGMCGIPRRRDHIIRPLLSCTRRDVERYCEEHALDYVTDSTNLVEDCSRNKIRLSVMPKLRELNPSVEESIARMSGVTRDVEDFLTEYSAKELKSCEIPYGYSCERLLALPDAVRRYALRGLMEAEDIAAEHRHYAMLDDAMRSGGSVDLSGGRVVCAQGVLRIQKGEPSSDTAEIPLRSYPGVQYISAKELKNVHKKFLDDCIRCDIITESTVLRHRRAGDTFAPASRGVTKSLRKFMNERKIPTELRDTLYVVADGSTVLWLQGTGAGEEARADRDTDAVYIKINP